MQCDHYPATCAVTNPTETSKENWPDSTLDGNEFKKLTWVELYEFLTNNM